MTMIPIRWTADKIRTEFKTGKTPMVTCDADSNFRNLTAIQAAKMTGTYLVKDGAYEIVVFIHTQKV